MTKQLPGENITLLINKQIDLPSPPAIAVHILNAVQNKESSLLDLEKIISTDPALTGKMLRLANSAFYSLPQKVTNISRALSILGTNIIKNIALSFVIANDLRGDNSSSFDYNYFWKRSVTTAVAAELITNILQKKNEDIFVASLLQDIGMLTLFMTKGQEYATTLKDTLLEGDDSLLAAEQNQYMFDHQQLGYTLLANWELPPAIIVPIRYHHAPEYAPEEYSETATILYLSQLLSSVYNSTEGSTHARKFQIKIMEFFDVTSEQAKQLIDDVVPRSLDILQIFELDPGEMKPYSQLLQAANAELSKLNLSYEQLVLELKESQKKSAQLTDELRRANHRLKQLAFHDGLTNLFNHRYFQETLLRETERARRYSHSLSLIMFDIDYFKKINDSFGHPTGDKVLVNLAQSIAKAVRPSDIISRYGGEEFTIILPETNESGLKVFAERLRRIVMSMTTVVNEKPIKITISSGGTCFTPNRTNITRHDIINTADRALYMSKTQGRNRTTILPLS